MCKYINDELQFQIRVFHLLLDFVSGILCKVQMQRKVIKWSGVENLVLTDAMLFSSKINERTKPN